MDSDSLLKFANMFCALAGGEELPDDSKELKTVLSNLEKLETKSSDSVVHVDEDDVMVHEILVTVARSSTFECAAFNLKINLILMWIVN